jgi:hypothetical protein
MYRFHKKDAQKVAQVFLESLSENTKANLDMA